MGFQASPSQVSTKRDCSRKWGFSALDGLPTPETPAALLGTLFHDIIEAHLRGDAAEAPAVLIEAIAKGRELGLVPPPGVGSLEDPFVWGVLNGLARVSGRYDHMDLVEGVPTVTDWKTTSDARYPAESFGPDRIRGDAQTQGYALAAALRWPDAAVARGVVVRFVAFELRKVPGAPPGTTGNVGRDEAARRRLGSVREYRVHLTIDEVRAGWLAFLADVEEMLGWWRAGKRAKDLPPNTTACSKYGGCPFSASRGGPCHLSVSEVLRAHLSPPAHEGTIKKDRQVIQENPGPTTVTTRKQSTISNTQHPADSLAETSRSGTNKSVTPSAASAASVGVKNTQKDAPPKPTWQTNFGGARQTEVRMEGAVGGSLMERLRAKRAAEDAAKANGTIESPIRGESLTGTPPTVAPQGKSDAAIVGQKPEMSPDVAGGYFGGGPRVNPPAEGIEAAVLAVTAAPLEKPKRGRPRKSKSEGAVDAAQDAGAQTPASTQEVAGNVGTPATSPTPTPAPTPDPKGYTLMVGCAYGKAPDGEMVQSLIDLLAPVMKKVAEAHGSYHWAVPLDGKHFVECRSQLAAFFDEELSKGGVQGTILCDGTSPEFDAVSEVLIHHATTVVRGVR